MDLLERYLQAVGRYLPEATREDVMAELRANLLEQMDGRAAELGRPLAESDVAAVLKEHGKPEVVALRYLPQRSLIGPTVFPFYVFTLRRALPVVLLIYAIAEGASLVADGGQDVATGIVMAFVKVVPTLLVFWATVTILFAVFEYAQGESWLGTKFNEWDPAKLPPLKTEAKVAAQKSLGKRVVELLVHSLWMAYVVMVPWHLSWRFGAGTVGVDLDSFGVAFAPVWHVFYGLLLVLLSVQLVMKVLALKAGPHVWMKPMELATNLLGVVALGIVASSNVLFVPASATVDLHKLVQVNLGIGLAMRIALVFAVLGLATETWKYVRQRVPTHRLAF